MNEDLKILLIGLAVFVAVIVLIVLGNKLLDHLSDRFPIGYSVFMIMVAAVSFGLSFMYWHNKAAVEAYLASNNTQIMHDYSMSILITQIIFYYFYMTLFLTDIEEGDDDTPGFVRKIGFSILGTGLLTLTTIFKNFSWIAFVLQIIMPLLIIINCIRRRIKCNPRT